MRKVVVSSVVVLAMSVAPAFATGRKSNASTKRMTDQQFVVNAATANTTEVELGKVAENKTTNDQVRNFAKLMVADHEKALSDLQTVAKNQNITLPTSLDSKDEALKDRLDKFSGKAFDRAYMSAMVRDHRNDVVEFRTEAENATTTAVKQYASNTLPILKDHLKLAREIDRSVVGASVKPGTKHSVS